MDSTSYLFPASMPQLSLTSKQDSSFAPGHMHQEKILYLSSIKYSSVFSFSFLPLFMYCRAIMLFYRCPHFYVTTTDAAHAIPKAVTSGTDTQTLLIFFLWRFNVLIDTGNIFLHRTEQLAFIKIPYQTLFAESPVLVFHIYLW